MKNVIAITLIAVSCAAIAAAETVQMRFSVPFAFQIERQTFPAAEYRIEFNQATGGMILTSTYGSTGVFLRTAPAFRPGGLENRGKLEFRQYGDTFFLQKVWVSGSGTGRQIIPSAKEREMARIAQKSGKIVSVAGGTE